ncbi:MAG: NAD-dependent epimerase/dehydratase family protein [Elusimicrobiota bacterium]
MKIMILGHSGFIGSHLLEEKIISNCEKILPSRKVSSVYNKDGDLLVPYEKAFEYADKIKTEVIVNLIGVLREKKEGEYERAHVKTAENIAKYSEYNKAKVIHISALGPEDCSGSLYFSTKRKAEKVLNQKNSDLIIIRPGIVLGEGQKILSDIKKISSFSPFIFCPDSKTAVINVKRLTSIIAKAVVGEIKPGTYQAYDEISDFKSFFEKSLDIIKVKRKVIPLPISFFLPMAALGEIIDFFPINKEQYKMMICGSLPLEKYPKL